MPTFHAGNGGKLEIGATAYEITSWTMTKEVELANVTNSGSSGWQEVYPTVKKATGTIEMPWDSENIPDTDMGMDVGDSVTLDLFLGDSTKFYVVPARIRSLVPVCNNQQDIVRISINWESNGAITDPVT